MSRPTIGLALGSGSARGLAHIGVLKVLEEEKIPIDLIAGSSIGAVVGAYYAVHGEVSSLEEKIKSMKRKDWLSLVDLSDFKHELIKGNKIEKYLDQLFEGKTFSQTKIPFKAVASDLNSGKAVAFDRGSISECVRASISIPGIFKPVIRGDKFLVDGQILDPTPANIVKRMGADIIISVDLPMMPVMHHETINIMETIMWSYEVIREKINKRGRNIVLIAPEFKDNFSGWKFMDSRFIDIGTEAAQKAVLTIKNKIKMFNKP